MASCYSCGKSGADFRRTMNTGTSYGTSYGKSAYSSTRTYYGLRTVCENCAAQVDKSNNIKTIILLIITAFVLLYFINR